MDNYLHIIIDKNNDHFKGVSPKILSNGQIVITRKDQITEDFCKRFVTNENVIFWIHNGGYNAEDNSIRAINKFWESFPMAVQKTLNTFSFPKIIPFSINVGSSAHWNIPILELIKSEATEHHKHVRIGELYTSAVDYFEVNKIMETIEELEPLVLLNTVNIDIKGVNSGLVKTVNDLMGQDNRVAKINNSNVQKIYNHLKTLIPNA